MATRKINPDPNKPMVIKLNLSYVEKQKVRIKCIRHNVTITDILENTLRDWIKEIPDSDIKP